MTILCRDCLQVVLYWSGAVETQVQVGGKNDLNKTLEQDTSGFRLAYAMRRRVYAGHQFLLIDDIVALNPNRKTISVWPWIHFALVEINHRPKFFEFI